MTVTLFRADSQGDEEEVGTEDGEDDGGDHPRPGQDGGEAMDRETEESILGQSPGSCGLQLSEALVFLPHGATTDCCCDTGPEHTVPPGLIRYPVIS